MTRVMLACLLLSGGCGGGPAADPRGGDAADQPSDDDFGPAPTFSLVDQTGTPRTQADFAGRVWVADFFFTSCPDVCPLLAAKMAALQVQFPWALYVSFSVDPGTDTPPRLAAYAERFHAQPGWYFLTGPVEDIRKVVVDGFKQAMQETNVKPGEPQEIIHGDRFVVVDKKGRLRGFPEAGSPEVAEILARLKAE